MGRFSSMNRRGGEVFDEFAVDRGLELEVEVGDPAPVGEPGVAQSGGEAAVAVGGGLFGDEPGEELDMRPLVGAGLFGEGGERRPSGVQAEVAEVGFDLLVEAGAHASSPPMP